MTYIDLMLAWDMMAGLGGLKLKANQSFVHLGLSQGKR